MKSLYESVSHSVRASAMRADALACERAGFPGFATVNWETAELLDPTPRGFRRNHLGDLVSLEEESTRKLNHKAARKIESTGGASNGYDRSRNAIPTGITRPPVHRAAVGRPHVHSVPRATGSTRITHGGGTNR